LFATEKSGQGGVKERRKEKKEKRKEGKREREEWKCAYERLRDCKRTTEIRAGLKACSFFHYYPAASSVGFIDRVGTD